MKRIESLLLLAIVILMSSCWKEEEAVDPYPRGNSMEAQLEMGSGYEDQIYFNLGDNQIVKSNSKYLWDIAFSCQSDSTIRLNSGRNIRAANSGLTDFLLVNDTSGQEFKWDWSNGKNDSTALYGAFFGDNIFIIDLGSDADFNSLGFIKARFTLDGENLQVEYASLESNDTKTVTLIPDQAFNHVHYSFLTDEYVSAEPPKASYDVVFTQYVYYFEEEQLAYLVVGTLINPYSTVCYKEFELAFDDISASEIDEGKFSTDHDIIGYDWKYFNLGEGTFVVQDEQNYILKDSDGFFYKLHFTGFYNKNGEKGYPVIAHAKI